LLIGKGKMLIGGKMPIGEKMLIQKC